MKTTPNGLVFEEIFFSYTGKEARSCDGYGQIKKTESKYDMAIFSDDVIVLHIPGNDTPIHIDCNKDTGEFKLFFPVLDKDENGTV
tara:strand:- start:727 stop:984 length:258 start_codon:yes stop_codon:yes gene_type:complete